MLRRLRYCYYTAVPAWAYFVFAFLCIYFNSFMQVCTELVAPPYDRQAVLLDTGFAWLGWFVADGYNPVVDYMAVAYLVITFVAIVIVPVSNTQLRSPRMVICARFAMLIGLAFVLRGICISTTVMPPPQHGCKSTIRADESKLWQALLVILQQRTTCADSLPSGHTITIVLAILFLLSYTYVGRVDSDLGWFTYLMYAILIGGVLFELVIIVGTHFHYTTDVIFGALIATTFFYIAELSLPLIPTGEEESD